MTPDLVTVPRIGGKNEIALTLIACRNYRAGKTEFLKETQMKNLPGIIGASALAAGSSHAADLEVTH